jgi:hypothetical protein
VIRAGGGGGGQSKRRFAVIAARHQLELGAVGGQEQHVDPVEADHVARGTHERRQAIVAIPRILHEHGGVGEPLEQ